MSVRRARRAVVGVAVLTTAVAVGVPGAGAAAARHGWSQSGGNPAHTGLVAHPGGLTPATVGSLAFAGSATLSDFPQTTPAIAGGTAYVATHSGLVVAVDTATRHQTWQHHRCSTGEPAGNASEDTTPAVGDGRVFVSEADGHTMTMIRLSAPHHRTCLSLQPATQPGGTTWSPTVAGRTVYAIVSSRVDAFDATTGHLRWSHPLPAGADPAADVTVWHGTAYAAFNTTSATGGRGHVYALRAASGHLRWRVSRPGYLATLAAAHGRLVAGGAHATAWNAVTGQHLWTGTCSGVDAVSLVRRSVVVTGGEAGSCQGSVQRLDAATGGVVWATPLASELEDQAAVGGGLVYLVDLDTSDVDVLRLGDGVQVRTLHRAAAPYDGVSTPVVVDGTLWVSTSEAALDEWALPG